MNYKYTKFFLFFLSLRRLERQERLKKEAEANGNINPSKDEEIDGLVDFFF